MENLVLYDRISQCLTLAGVARKKGRSVKEDDLGIIRDAAVVVNADKNTIAWVGPSAELPAQYRNIVNVYSGEGEVWFPELVECHTHLIFGGTRHKEYGMRCGGMTYQQIAAQGGGILSTISHTRDAAMESLITDAAAELDRFQKYGVGTVEIKSGYGLTLESEVKILRCVEQLRERTNVELVATFLPAHAIPPEYRGRADDFVEAICKEWIPVVAEEKLATFFDAFVEQGYFSVAQTRKMCDVAREHGFKIKLHVDQFTDLGGTALAVEVGATSCDHLDNVSDASIAKIGNSDTVAVLAPGASLFTGTPFPPARKLIDAGARVAVTTDFNPGTCPSRNLPLMTTIACSQMKMTIPEVIAGVTYNAAAALGLEDKLGSLEVGKHFRICPLKTDSYESLPYSFGELE